MTTLILKDAVIVAASPLVNEMETGFSTPDAFYPWTSGITGTVEVSDIPADFAPHRYQWVDGALDRLPDPPPTQAQIDAVIEARRLAYVAESDHLFMAWQGAAATDAPDQNARKAAWLAARNAVRTRFPYPG